MERNGYPYIWLLAMLVSVGLVAIVQYLILDIDPPFLTATLSRALYVDEGFYADAAQNFVKFGQWDMPYDSRHWPGAPLLVVLQTPVFSVFGVSLNAARMISIIFAMLGCLALYSIARTRLDPVVAALLVISCAITFSFFAHSRAAIADPVATSLMLMSIFAYVRIRSRYLSIPLSLLFAYMALFAKMYFLFVLLGVTFLWCVELLLMPLFRMRKFEFKAIVVLVSTLVAIVVSYWIFRTIFIDEITNFLEINKNKKPLLTLLYFYYVLPNSFKALPFDTKTHVFLVILALSAVYFLISRMFPSKFRNLASDIKSIGRAEWAMGVILTMGIFMVGSLLQHKSHYYYFAILPISFLALTSIALIIPVRFRFMVIAGVLFVHFLFQASLYQEWAGRPHKKSIDTASRAITEHIHQRSSQEVIPVIGEYSAQLALYSDKILSLDEKWINRKGLCERISYWRPRYHVFVTQSTWLPKKEKYLMGKCDVVEDIAVIARYPTFDPWKDEIVFSHIRYQDE